MPSANSTAISRSRRG
ncbi:hypothetical protein YPPY11_4692, partial [Yersinia pestis PY-11]